MDTNESSLSSYTFHNPRMAKIVINLGCSSMEFDLREMASISINHMGTRFSISINQAKQVLISGSGIAVNFHLDGDTVRVDIVSNKEFASIMRAMSNIDQMAGPGGLYDFTVRRSPFGSDFDLLRDKPRFGAEGNFDLHNILRDLENSPNDEYPSFRHRW
jgi:hypothetical protein